MANGLNAGDLDREIVLQTKTVTTNPKTGEQVETWDQNPVTIWANWDPSSSREIFAAQNRQAAYVDGVFRIYWREPRPMPERNRIVFDGTVYDIRPAIEVGRREFWDLPAVARAEAES